MESLQTKTPRKRVANFTADEKALMAQLIKKRPIVESKLTDGKSVGPQHGAIISLVEEAAPVVITEINNPFDSDGAILHTIDNSQELDLIGNNDIPTTSETIDNLDNIDIEYKVDSSKNSVFEVRETIKNNSPQIEDEQSSIDYSDKKNAAVINTTNQVRRPTDYIRREAVIRIRHLENKKKMEMQILKTQLEIVQIKKRAALIEEEREKNVYQKKLK